jgi:hypothetical protein
MKKIDKDLALATSYKKWLEGLKGKKHPTYTSSNHKYYYDIIANLLWVQQGLCAYTEMFLINKNNVSKEKWAKGGFPKFEFLGQLDHFNPTLKEKKGWEWDNFFVVHSDVNVKRKRDKKINGIIKPDKETYDPFYFLEYDFKQHHFLPNRNRTTKEQDLILEDVNTLGLNFQPIIDYRIEYLKPIIDEVQLGIITIAKARQKLNKFYTAFEMSLSSLGLNDESKV